MSPDCSPGYNKICLSRISAAARLVSLAVLFGGCSAIVFAAITLVGSARAQGIATAQAAAANAPVFIHFSKVMLGAGIALLLSEALDFASAGRPGRLKVARYAASLACVAATMVFALGIVPPMAELLPLMHGTAGIASDNLARVYSSFHRFHEMSRIVFGGTIIFALASLLLPVFESHSAHEACCAGDKE